MLRKTREKGSDYFFFGKSLRAILVISVFNNLGSSIWTPLLGIYVTGNLFVPLIIYGLMSSIQRLVSSMIVFPSGLISDRFGRKKMIALSIISSIMALVALSLANDLPWLFLVSVFQGLSTAFMQPSKSAYVIDLIQNERRGIAFSTLALFQSLSNIIATFLGGIGVVILGFKWIFRIAGILQILSLFGAIIWLEESLVKDSIKMRISQKSIFDDFKKGLAILKRPSLLAVLFGVVFHQLGLGIQNPYLTIYARDALFFSLPAISLMLSMQRLGIFIGHFPSGRIVDKYGGEISFAFHILATSPAMILYAITGSHLFSSSILFSWGLTFGLDNVSRQKLISKHQTESGVAAAFGVVSLIAGIVSLIAPTIGGWMWTSFSPQSVFYTSAMVNVLGSIPLFILWLSKEKTHV
jgi:DHA1 family multidrug resistance protein-like MFS transporter